MDWEKLGLKMGLEIHQQLNTKLNSFVLVKLNWLMKITMKLLRET